MNQLVTIASGYQIRKTVFDIQIFGQGSIALANPQRWAITFSLTRSTQADFYLNVDNPSQVNPGFDIGILKIIRFTFRDNPLLTISPWFLQTINPDGYLTVYEEFCIG